MSDPEPDYGYRQTRTLDDTEAPALTYQPPVPRRRHRIGLIGCGGVSAFHLAAYRQAGLEVVALCDRHPQRAEERRAAQAPDARVFADAAGLLAWDEVEVVDITTHPADRIELVEAALESGRHVLSQKPFALDLDSARRLADLADARGLRLAVNQNGRWAPYFSYMRAALEQGLIGDVEHLDCVLNFDHNWTAGTPFNDVPQLMLYDFAVHFFDAASVFFRGRRARSVQAVTARADSQDSRPPLLAGALLEFEGGLANLSFNGNSRVGQHDLTVLSGSGGCLRSEGGSLNQKPVEWISDRGRAHVELEGSWFVEGFIGSMTELLCAIEQDREPMNSARDNLRTLELCFAAVASAEGGGRIEPGKVRRLPEGAAGPVGGPQAPGR